MSSIEAMIQLLQQSGCKSNVVVDATSWLYAYYCKSDNVNDQIVTKLTISCFWVKLMVVKFYKAMPVCRIKTRACI